MTRHPNIIRFVGFYVLSKEWILVLERVSFLSLSLSPQLLIFFQFSLFLFFLPPWRFPKVDGLELQDVVDRHVEKHKKSIPEVLATKYQHPFTSLSLSLPILSLFLAFCPLSPPLPSLSFSTPSAHRKERNICFLSSSSPWSTSTHKTLFFGTFAWVRVCVCLCVSVCVCVCVWRCSLTYLYAATWSPRMSWLFQ